MVVIERFVYHFPPGDCGGGRRLEGVGVGGGRGWEGVGVGWG